MRKLLLTVFIAFPLLAVSQATLTSALAPPVNSMFIFNDANVPSPPFTFSKTGTNNTWDFTAIAPVAGADDTTFIVSPASITGGSSFPTATHCMYEAGEGSFTMVQVAAGGVSMLGSVADVAGNGTLFPLVANQPLTVMPFPYTYGSSGGGSTYFELFGTGSDIGQPVDSVHYKSTIISQRDVIAGGNMIIPAGTFPAILERSIDTNIDTLWVKGAITLNQWVVAPGFPQTSTDSAFYWYSNQSLLPYAHALYDATGLHDVNYFKSSTTSVSEINSEETGIYPNPATDFIYTDAGQCDAYIYNSTGQLVSSYQNTTDKISVANLNKGYYILKLIGNDSRIRSMSFIKD